MVAPLHNIQIGWVCFLLDTATMRMETGTIAAFAAIVPGQVAVTAAKTEDAALNMVWNSTHINTPLFPDTLRIAPKKKRSANQGAKKERANGTRNQTLTLLSRQIHSRA